MSRSDSIEFVRNYSDMSTDRGFHFESNCDRCGTGFGTRFKAGATGTVTEVLGAASSLFGGFLGSAADSSERVRSAGWPKAHDEAFEVVVVDLKP